jgi:hypothetical protein
MLLSEVFESIPKDKRVFAAQLFEAASDPLSHSDIRGALNDQLDDMHPGQCCVQDVFGDDQSGDVVYSKHDPKTYSTQMMKAPYTLGTTNGKRTAEIDEESATNVVPRTTYEEEADDDDSMVSMEASRKREKLYKVLPTYERFISKGERDAADAGSFAGKGKSFPILKPGDVKAAVSSMGRAGSDNHSTGTLKKNIIAIAKKKGWGKYLPKAWQGGSESSNSDDNSNTSESRRASGNGPLKLMESSNWKEETLALIEASGAPSEMEIKLIAPGAGSSAFYPKEVLQRDGPRVFTKGTHVYVNHPTAAEEAARPEGDWHKLAGALSTDAYWKEDGKHGPGLYGKALFTSDYAPLVKEKAAFTGMSIRASGKAESGTKKNGLPVLTELTSAESVDIVTRAGAGGMVLSEAAKSANSNREVEDMNVEELNRLVESAVTKGVSSATAPLRERLLKADATTEAMRLLEGVALPAKAKELIMQNVVERGDIPATSDGELNTKKFREAVDAEMQRVGQLVSELSGGGRVFTMGQAEPSKQELKEAKRDKKAAKEARKGAVSIFESLGMDSEAAKIAARGREVA